MYSDEDEDDLQLETESSEHDKKLEELWSKKQRRRSSDFKIIQGDKLKLQENSKIIMLMLKNGEFAQRVLDPQLRYRGIMHVASWIMSNAWLNILSYPLLCRRKMCSLH